MNSQYHPFDFYHKIVQRDTLQKLKEEFISDMDDTIDTYDPETETKIILDRNSLLSPTLNVKEIIVPFRVHIENMVKTQESELINYIRKQYFEDHILDRSNRFLNGVLNELNKISNILKWDDYKEIELIISNSLKRIFLVTSEYVKNEEETFASENLIIFNINLEVFRTELFEQKLIAEISFPDFRSILKNETPGSKIEWKGKKGETYYLFEELKRLNLITTTGDIFWESLGIYFNSKTISQFGELRTQHKPKSTQRVDRVLHAIRL